jgi:hypothetical protein
MERSGEQSGDRSGKGVETMHRDHRFDRARGTRVILTIALAAIWLGTLGARSAHAQQKCTQDMTEQQLKDNAVQWWQQATKLYERKRYRQSIEPYQHAYDCAVMLPSSDKATKTAANFLFNIAQAHRQLGECGPAIQRYRRYLTMTRKLTGDAQVRDVQAAVTVTLAELEEECPEQAAEEPAEETSPPDRSDGDGASTPQAPEESRPAEITEDDEVDDGPEDARIGVDAAGGPELLSLSIAAGPTFIRMDDLDVPAQVAFALRAGHPMRLGALGVEIGAAFTYTPVPWNNRMAEASGTAALWGILLNAGVSYPLMDRLSARADLGLGVLNFSGLGNANPFTLGGGVPDRPLTMFNARVELGLAYAITPNLVVSASPFVLAYSPADKSLSDLVGSLLRYELLIGAGYRL